MNQEQLDSHIKYHVGRYCHCNSGYAAEKCPMKRLDCTCATDDVVLLNPGVVKKLDMHRFMTDDAYLIEHIGGQAVFDAFTKEMEAVMGTALDTEETE